MDKRVARTGDVVLCVDYPCDRDQEQGHGRDSSAATRYRPDRQIPGQGLCELPETDSRGWEETDVVVLKPCTRLEGY